MVYKEFGKTVVIRMDTDDDIHASIIDVCLKTGITSGAVSGVGATSYAEIHAGDEAKGTFGSSEHHGKMELVSLTGNITIKEGQITPHLHVVLSGPRGLEVFAGHLEKGIVINTAEVYIQKLDGTITKKPVGPWYFMDLHA